MIKKLKWNNHYSLGNLELNFRKDDGTAYNTIILAGENGTGKTTILDTLSDFLNGHSIQPFEYIEYGAGGVDYHIVPDDRNWMVGFHKRAIVGTEEYETVNTGRNNSEDVMRNDAKDIRHYGFSYSKARSGFNTGQVKSITTQQVDAEKFEPDDQDNFTRIKQLIVDIEQQDDAAWRAETLQGNVTDRKYEDFVIERSKGYRFKKAFNEFFGDVTYKGIDNSNAQEKKVIFEKHGKQISVDKLSTGEKQIVFRGAHLLRNVNNITGGIVLIDEPELSMHPMWQKKILQYYRGLFSKNDGSQTVQMIIATHSSYVIQEALKDQNNVLVIVLQDNNGVIKAERITTPGILPQITPAETNYMAFHVPTIDYHIELYGWLQRKNGDLNVKQCDDHIKNSQQYDSSKHSKPSLFTNNNGHTTTYDTLPTYIRNAIDHPNPSRSFTDDELRISIELLMELCK